MEHVNGFVDTHIPDHVYKLKKASYDLKQASRVWYERFTKFLIDHQFDRGSVHNTLFFKKNDGHILMVHNYVDDIIFGSTDEAISHSFSQTMKSEFEMSMEKKLKNFLCLRIRQTKSKIFVNQPKFSKDLVKKFSL